MSYPVCGQVLCNINSVSCWWGYENNSDIPVIFSSPELAQGELLGYRDVGRPSYVWTSVTSETSETYETSETSVRQLFSLCTL